MKRSKLTRFCKLSLPLNCIVYPLKHPHTARQAAVSRSRGETAFSQVVSRDWRTLAMSRPRIPLTLGHTYTLGHTRYPLPVISDTFLTIRVHSRPFASIRSLSFIYPLSGWWRLIIHCFMRQIPQITNISKIPPLLIDTPKTNGSIFTRILEPDKIKRVPL